MEELYFTPAMAAHLFPPRKRDAHKGDFGYVAVMGGCLEYSGAAKLANLAALAASSLYSGCGVVRLAVPSLIAEGCLPYLLESTLFPLSTDPEGKILYKKEELDLLLTGLRALGAGCGMGRGKSHPRLIEALLAREGLRLVLDADALNVLSEMEEGSLKRGRASVTITPHFGEFSRLTGVSVTELKKDPVTHAKGFAERTGAILLLKGNPTIVTDGDRVVFVSAGCPGMATAGSGDVLTGILTGLLGYLPMDLLTIAAGAWVNGRAGELASAEKGELSMTASDTAGHIFEAFSELTGGR